MQVPNLLAEHPPSPQIVPLENPLMQEFPPSTKLEPPAPTTAQTVKDESQVNGSSL